jgi:hypothetical protein
VRPQRVPLDIQNGDAMARNQVVRLGALLSLLCAACADPGGIVQPGGARAAPAAGPASASVGAATTSTVVLTNGAGSCGIGALVSCFTYLSDGTYTWFSRNGYVVLYYTNGTSKVYSPFVNAVSATGTATFLWTGTFSGVDPSGRTFHASAEENLYHYYSRGGGGRGGGGAGWRYRITGGSVTFRY